MKRACLLLFFMVFCTALPAVEKNYGVYFTDPAGKSSKDYVTPEAALTREIRCCKTSFYGAFYEISADEVASELVSAAKRGVDVRLVVDDENFSGSCINKLLEAGVPVVTDRGPGLMHNKFAVIDMETVFTGSYNTTDNCAHKNNNNAVIFRSALLAEIYSAEFEEMFTGKIFGNRDEPGAFADLMKSYSVKVDGMDINVYFSPEDNIESVIYDRIRKAGKSVYFMYFSFTSDDIGELMIEKHNEGVEVAGIFEKKGSSSEYSEYTKLRIEGINVELDTNKHNMHHKVLIIDGEIVITGSYNLSRNADMNNDENIIIIYSSEIAAMFLAEFNRLYPGGVKWD